MSFSVSERKLGVIYLPLAQQLAIESRGVGRRRERRRRSSTRASLRRSRQSRSVQALFIVGRTAGDPAPMLKALAGIVRRADPDLAVEGAATGPMAMASPQIIFRMAAIFTGGLSILAVSLAMLGLYGVLSHVVARRTREMGLRLALGAGIGDVRRMVLGEGLSPVMWGLGLGTIAGALLRALYTWQKVSWVDPVAFTVATVTLLARAFSPRTSRPAALRAWTRTWRCAISEGSRRRASHPSRSSSEQALETVGDEPDTGRSHGDYGESAESIHGNGDHRDHRLECGCPEVMITATRIPIAQIMNASRTANTTAARLVWVDILKPSALRADSTVAPEGCRAHQTRSSMAA